MLPSTLKISQSYQLLKLQIKIAANKNPYRVKDRGQVAVVLRVGDEK